MSNALGLLAPFLDDEGRLTAIPAKHKKKLAALWYLVQRVEIGRRYTEQEINRLLNEWTTFCDPATLRREMYDRYLLERTSDCRAYWRNEQAMSLEEFVNQDV